MCDEKKREEKIRSKGGYDQDIKKKEEKKKQIQYRDPMKSCETVPSQSRAATQKDEENNSSADLGCCLLQKGSPQSSI